MPFRFAGLPRETVRGHSGSCLAALAGGLLWLLGACAARPVTTPPQPSPECRLEPQPTGEKYVGATVEASPPQRVSPGQEVAVVLSGAYGLIVNNAVVCGSGEIVDYVHHDELPAFNWTRTVEVRLDGRALTTAECENPCRIEFVVPAQTLPGVHTLSLVTAPAVEPVTFEIEVVAP